MKAILCLTLMASLLSSCSRFEPVTAIGSGLGALAGGVLSGGEAKAAAAGAAVGGVIGKLGEGLLGKTRKKAYEKGYAEGSANEIKRAYWRAKQVQSQPSELNRHYYAIPVPEHTAADGVKIGGHIRYISTVE